MGLDRLIGTGWVRAYVGLTVPECWDGKSTLMTQSRSKPSPSRVRSPVSDDSPSPLQDIRHCRDNDVLLQADESTNPRHWNRLVPSRPPPPSRRRQHVVGILSASSPVSSFCIVIVVVLFLEDMYVQGTWQA
ncbi:hypothetical protein SAMD00023353_0100270 [Rosellinia necatrix]|uniref:Uncharacterized protein n=1 Tax=Rosellinia necatrix TaxID=77044 RepID=A0A1S8A4U2_ROSNE|nr:hypothetical protein SAMD00023353_0100270 [Rosellinia necatrix]